ncbi:MAG: hypothetical protein JSU66_13275 [Deltaproteobacteria bacterium]|nr:MAG: hypothetical protein JSU66_13275 [Deltaproteobacteria bacterium]
MSSGETGVPQATARGVRRRLSPEEILLAVLVALSLAGVAVMDFSQRYGLWYWLAMAPVFGGVSIYGGWARARRHGESAPAILRVQLLHWITLILAVLLVYVLQQTGRLTDEDAGFVALLALALTTFLAGVHFDWRFCVLGVVLGITLAGAALVTDFFWILLVPALLAGALFVFWKWRRA